MLTNPNAKKQTGRVRFIAETVFHRINLYVKNQNAKANQEKLTLKSKDEKKRQQEKIKEHFFGGFYSAEPKWKGTIASTQRRNKS